MVEYQLKETVLLRTNVDGSVSSIPIDEANSDYQAYLKHLTENPTQEQSWGSVYETMAMCSWCAVTRSN